MYINDTCTCDLTYQINLHDSVTICIKFHCTQNVTTVHTVELLHSSLWYSSGHNHGHACLTHTYKYNSRQHIMHHLLTNCDPLYIILLLYIF